MIRTIAVAAATAALVACNGDPAPKKPVDPLTPASASAGSAAPTAGGSLPADQQCLWLNICDKWSGCAHVAKAPQYWKVITADRLAPGDLVDVLDMCSGAPVCLAARGVPKGEKCTNTTTTFIPEPDYTCAWTGTACVPKPKPKAAP
jgi:hypothetical protein